MGFALFFNIIAVIVSTVASIILIIFTAALNEFYSDWRDKCSAPFGNDNQCQCTLYDGSYSSTSETCKYKDILLACLIIIINRDFIRNIKQTKT